MREFREAAACATLLFSLAACQSGERLEAEDVLAAESVEVQMDGGGDLVEVEYHILPPSVPPAVRSAMDRLHPGGRAVGAEREVNDGVLYWELSHEVGGFEVEAMFLPDGTLHAEEIQVARDKVPSAIVDAVGRAWPGCIFRTFEEIRDGTRNLVEYHVKIDSGGKKYKVMVGTDGHIQSTVREVPAEIEVPVR